MIPLDFITLDKILNTRQNTCASHKFLRLTMHLWNFPALVLTVMIRYSALAIPITEPRFLPRNHVECDPTSHLCQIQQTCDNAPSIVAGT